MPPKAKTPILRQSAEQKYADELAQKKMTKPPNQQAGSCPPTLSANSSWATKPLTSAKNSMAMTPLWTEVWLP